MSQHTRTRLALAVSVNNIVYTVNAFRPTRRSRVLFGWSFFASWITIELAWFHLIWQVLGTLFLGRAGSFKRAEGKAALALAVTSWVGLGVMIKQSFDARDEIKAALRGAAAQPVPRRKLPIKVTRNVEYAMVKTVRRRRGLRSQRGEAAERLSRLKLDVYRPLEPPAADERRPVIVQVHGGGWVIGDKREQGLPLLKLLASQGWVGFNVNYRLSPGVAFPEMLIDLKRAVAWIRENAEEYGIDPNFIAVTGGSAGGHLSSLLALTANDAEYQPGFEDADTSVQAAVPFYGVYDFTNRNGHWLPGTVDSFIGAWVMQTSFADDPEAFAKASPMDQVRADAPPFLVIHGDRDTLAPVEDARDFARRLEAVSQQPVHYLELHGAQHAFDLFPSIRCNAVIGGVDQFLTYCYEMHRTELAEPDALELDTDAARASAEPPTADVRPVVDEDAVGQGARSAPR
ncbi:MAG: alpha/beta hydrolase [Actinobacteria bacterium]|nr:alpha/beta hydrolase [Actinomycetota bacterium]